jgi:hypothetical protein
MSLTKIESLTPEQEALIPVYREKWKAIALSTEPINRQKASDAVKAAYTAVDKEEPEILFFDSPNLMLYHAALNKAVLSQPDASLRNLLAQLRGKLERHLWKQLDKQLKAQIQNQFWSETWSEPWRESVQEPWHPLWSQLGDQLYRSWSYFIHDCIRPEELARQGSWLDFCASVLGCSYEKKIWEAFYSLATECGWILAFKKICFVCDRPIKFSFDRENRLHAEGEPAIRFVDEFSVYAYHGVTLPEKYGKLHPNQWQAQWLLEEHNTELRRVLIQEIGYERICQELQATELDSWQEYTLLIIEYVDIEPIYLLKMTCPSTGFIHALRVPPDIQSAREAIRWVNWGINPEEFAVQT